MIMDNGHPICITRRDIFLKKYEIVAIFRVLILLIYQFGEFLFILNYRKKIVTFFCDLFKLSENI